MERAHTTPAVLPLRPLTVGELLDSSVALLRTSARPLLALGAGLALAEQALLEPLRYLAAQSADAALLSYVLFACGLGTESLILALLASPAARAAGATLRGRTLTTRQLLADPGNRWGATVLVALVVAGMAGFAALACAVPWLLVYGFIGLAVPALVLEPGNPGAALLRSFTLTTPRVYGIRLLGYLSWLLLRLALGFAGMFALRWFGFDSPVLLVLPWLAANAVAYPALACLDAALYLEARVRREGMDLALVLAQLGAPKVAR
ncbi:MAG: hypothetical protein ACRDTM_12360 [Micromonosporaceae bacterium]